MKRPAAASAARAVGAAASGLGKRPRQIAGLAQCPPEQLGLCPERLKRLDDYFAKHPAFSGSVVALARRGKVCHFQEHGLRDDVRKLPMEKDSIFRIYSLSKIVTSVAVMQLYEKGLFQLDDPLHKFMPRFADMSVLVEGSETETEPATGPITVRHLLTHTSGLVYGLFADTPVDRMYKEAGALPQATGRLNLADFTDAVAGLPLKYHPGTRFEYSAATDVLGRLVEVLSGESFDQYLQRHIFEPLNMADTGFSLSEAQLPRLATLYEDAEDGGRQVCTSFAGMPTAAVVGSPPNFLSGGGGLYSTASDFLRFSLMLGGKGALGGTRLLGSRTVALMTQNHLPGGVDVNAIQTQPTPDFLHTRGLGFGLGVAVVLGCEFGWHCSAGSYFWQGLGCTWHLHDPNEDLTVVAMAQHMPVFSPRVFGVRAAVATLSAQALVD